MKTSTVVLGAGVIGAAVLGWYLYQRKKPQSIPILFAPSPSAAPSIMQQVAQQVAQQASQMTPAQVQALFQTNLATTQRSAAPSMQQVAQQTSQSIRGPFSTEAEARAAQPLTKPGNGNWTLKFASGATPPSWYWYFLYF